MTDDVTSVIIKVSKPGYVPKGVTIRMRIDDIMFTANVEDGLISDLKKDPNVVSVSQASKLQQID